MARLGQELNGGKPFRFGQRHILDERVQMDDEAADDLAQLRIGVSSSRWSTAPVI